MSSDSWNQIGYESLRGELIAGAPDGCRHEAARLRFCDWLGRDCIVYAERMIPASEEDKIPAILHAIGGGQKVETADLHFWADQGYACASFDWQIGDIYQRDPERSSQWPAGVVAQHAANEALENCILPLAIQAAQATLSWLLAAPGVDAERVGMSGISWGGYLTWATAAYDKRIRAICPVYGCGIFGEKQPPRPHAPEVVDYWKQHWDPQALAAKQTAPAAYLSGSNDFFGDLDQAEKLLHHLNVPHRWSLLANADHSLGPGESALARAWMAHYLKDGPALPEAPELGTDGQVRADASHAPAEQAVWWTNSRSGSLHACWSRGTPDASAHTAFARVTYADGLSLCSPLRRYQAAETITPLPTVWPDLRNGLGWRWELGSTQLHSNAVGIEPIDGGQALRITPSPQPTDHPVAFYLRQIQDRRWQPVGRERIRFRWQQDQAPERIRAHLIHHHPDCAQEMEVDCPRTGDEYTLTLPQPLSWCDVRAIRLTCQSPRQSFTFGPVAKLPGRTTEVGPAT